MADSVDISTKITSDSESNNITNSESKCGGDSSPIVKSDQSHDPSNESDNYKENDNIEVVADDNSTNKMMNVKESLQKSEPSAMMNQCFKSDFDWYKQYEDKILSQAQQAHRNAVLAASLQYLKPIERERFFAQFNGFNSINGNNYPLPPNRILTPPPSSSSSSSQQNISPQSSSSSSSTNEGLIERYYTPYQTTNNFTKSSGEQEKLVAAHQALLAQYAAQQFNAYQSHATNFQNHATAVGTPPTDARLFHQKMEKDRQSSFSVYNSLNGYFPASTAAIASSNINNNNNSSSNSSQKQGVSASTSSLSIDEQRASSPHTNSYDDNMDDENDEASGINGEDGENQSLNDTNGEWTYEEQFKQVSILYLLY